MASVTLPVDTGLYRSSKQRELYFSRPGSDSILASVATMQSGRNRSTKFFTRGRLNLQTDLLPEDLTKRSVLPCPYQAINRLSRNELYRHVLSQQGWLQICDHGPPHAHPPVMCTNVRTTAFPRGT